MNSTACNESALPALTAAVSLKAEFTAPSTIMLILMSAVAIPLNGAYIYTSRKSTAGNLAFVKRLLAASNITVSLSPTIGYVPICV